jgi:DNA-binding transcriptional ArsR family regulator
MSRFVHPAPEDITLTGLLAALGDPTRLEIVRLLSHCDGKNCTQSAPFPDMPRSTLTGHFRILREAGLLRTVKKGVENINMLRRAEIEARFPGLLDSILNSR